MKIYVNNIYFIPNIMHTYYPEDSVRNLICSCPRKNVNSKSHNPIFIHIIVSITNVVYIYIALFAERSNTSLAFYIRSCNLTSLRNNIQVCH